MEWQIGVILALVLIVAPLAIAGISAAPWVPTRKRDVKRVLDLAQIKKGDIVYDLGCGDGRIITAAAQERQAQCLGFEISWLQWLHSKFKILKTGTGKSVKVYLKSFYMADLSQASVVFIFLMPKVYQKLKAKMESELKSGSRIVVAVWPIPGWEKYLVKKSQPEKEKDVAFFLYKFK